VLASRSRHRFPLSVPATISQRREAMFVTIAVANTAVFEHRKS
jgi:hypothetical protein